MSLRVPKLSPGWNRLGGIATIPGPNTSVYRTNTSEGREWGVGSVVVDFRVFGAPRFSVQRPKPRNSTTTDPTPHSRPSEYINNSSKVVSCIRAGANAGATCIRADMNSLKNLARMRTMIPQMYFPVFTRVRIQAPRVFAQELTPQDFFPACIGFVPGALL